MIAAAPTASDLVAVAADLEATGSHGKLVRAVRQLLIVTACHADLRESLECCEAVDAVAAGMVNRNSTHRLPIERALLSTGVSLYARATSGGGTRDERGSIQISEHLTATQRADHDHIVEVRNRAVAHVYPGSKIAGTEWQWNKLLLVEVEGGWQPTSVSWRVAFSEATLKALKRQVPVAMQLIYDRYVRRVGQLRDQIAEASGLDEMVQRHLIDFANEPENGVSLGDHLSHFEFDHPPLALRGA